MLLDQCYEGNVTLSHHDSILPIPVSGKGEDRLHLDTSKPSLEDTRKSKAGAGWTHLFAGI